MNIDFFVGMFVVMPVGGGPPERAALHRAIAKDREEKLAEARGFEGPV